MKAISRTTFALIVMAAIGSKSYAQPTGQRVDSTIVEFVSASAPSVSGKDMEKYLSTDILTSLQGRIPGFNISQYRGSDLPRTSVNTSADLIGYRPASYGQLPYGDNTRFTLSSRGMSPVIIVDGIERDMVSLDPEAIESVTLKRDALSSMFLGMKSSRGALVITTKTPTHDRLRQSGVFTETHLSRSHFLPANMLIC